MEEIHDAGELRQASAEARELEEQHPGPEQAPEDKGLEDQPQVVEARSSSPAPCPTSDAPGNARPLEFEGQIPARWSAKRCDFQLTRVYAQKTSSHQRSIEA